MSEGEKDALDLVSKMKALGVLSFVFGNLEVEFFPPTSTVSALPDAKKLDEPESCRCGHRDHEHGADGTCLKGCPVEKCAGPEIAE